MADVLGAAVVEVGADTGNFQRDVEQGVASAKSAVSTLGKDMQNAGKRLSLSLTAPLTGIAGFAVKTQAAYEQSMNVLRVNTSATAAEMERMDGLAKQLGADTVFSAGEAAEAMLELAKGGFKPAQIAGGGVQAVMALAATEGLDLANAATIAGNAMNTFGLEAKDAADIADALAGGSMSSSASVDSLAQALQQVGPGARNAGLDLQDTVGVLASFASAGIQGSDAGTSLKTALTRLVPQTKKARDEMRELGLDFTNADGSIKDITEVAGILQDKLSGLSEEQRTTALATIFGSDATRAATVLMNEGEKGIRQYIKATKDQGSAQKLADARMEGTAGAIEKMKGSVETAALALGEALAPAVVKVSDGISVAADAFSNLSPEMQTTVAVIGAAVAAAGPLLFIGGSLIRTVQTLGGAFTTASAQMALFSSNMQTTTGRAAIMQGTMAKLGGVAKIAAGGAGVAALTASTQEGNKALGALEKAAGGAALGFSIGGPWGAAIGGAAGGIWGLVDAFKGGEDSAKEAASANLNYRKSLDKTTGAVTALTRAQARQNLMTDGAIKAARDLGIPLKDVVAAATGNEEAFKRVTKATRELTSTQGMSAASLVANRDKILGNAQSVDVLTDAIGQNVNAIKSAKRHRELTIMIRRQGLDQATTELNGLQKSMEKTGRTKADTRPFENSLNEGIGRARRFTTRETSDLSQMMGGVGKVRVNMDPFTNSLVGGLKAGTNQAAGVSFLGGVKIGSQLKQGMSSGFFGAVQNMAAQAAAAVRAAIAAAREEGDSHSPSREMMKVGYDLGIGGPLGLANTQKQWRDAGAALTNAALQGASGTIPAPSVAALPMARVLRTPRQATPSTVASAGAATAPAASVLPSGLQGGRGAVSLTIINNGPTTAGDMLREINWAQRFAVDRTPALTSEAS